MFKWIKRKAKPIVEDGYRIKMESIAAKEAIARRILGEERRKEDAPFEGHDRRFSAA
jgi:hypothetical protein